MPVAAIGSRNIADTTFSTRTWGILTLQPVVSRTPLAVVTQRLWLEWKRSPESSAYLIPYVFRLQPGIDPARLEKALRGAVEASESLRSVIEEVEGRPYQTVRSTPDRILEISDSWEWAVTRPFDLAVGPLFRFVLCGDIFVVNASHAVLDGEGIEMFLADTASRYAGEDVRAPGPGPAAWTDHEKAYFDSPQHEQDLEYWVAQMGTTDFHMALPSRRSTHGGEPDGIHHFSLPTPSLGMSPFLGLMAILKALLFRYTEQENISVLYPTNIRGPAFARSLGSFVNTLISTASFSPELTFRQLCEHVREQRRASREHAEVPFQQVVRALRLKRQVDSLELPNVTMAMSSFHPRFALGESVPLTSVDHQNDLLFMFQEVGERIEVRLHYRASLFTESFARELGDHFVVLAEQAQTYPDRAIATLCLATQAEKHRIETEWNPAPAPFDNLQLLHDAFADWAERTPEAPALLTRDRALSYGEVQALANRIAHGLRGRGVRPNTLVAVMMEKGWEQAVACLGILQSGAGYLPINASWPAERIDNVLKQGEVEIVLSQQRVLQRLGREGLAVDVPEVWASYPDERMASVNSLDDICYVIFTSGSTGKPKGVVLSHRGVMNTLRDCNQRYGVTESDRALQLSDLSFDISVYDIFGMLSAGGAVVIPDEERHLEPPHWIELVRQHQVTIWFSVPMYADMWVQSGEALPSLRLFMLAGDKIPCELPGRIRALMPSTSVWSLGGATEASIVSVWYEIGEVDPIWSSIPYGQAMTNQEMYVLDAGLNHCPPYMPGRIFIGGIGVALGYWRDPEKTAAAFITHPETGARIYNTGDLGRWLPDGQMEFLGRADFQVKVNGFRVELGEIEGAIQTLPGVTTTIVDALDQPGGNGKFLVAYMIMEGQLEVARIRADLQERLPYYMIPRFFVQLTEIPLSSNGKLDRKALPRPDLDQIAADHPYVAPRTATEVALVDLWQTLLKHEPIGIHDNFFALGGDSLQTIQFVMQARDAGLQISANAVQSAPTIAELVQRLGGGAAPTENAATGGAPLTPMQRYFLGWARNCPDHFNVSAVFRCDLDPERLRSALKKVVDHHDALRLRFDGNQQHYVEDGLEIPLEYAKVPLKGLTAQISRLQTTLNIAHGPIMRAGLFATEDGQRLVLICHHLVCDGVAWSFLLADLQRAYQDLPLPSPGCTFKAWSERLVEYAGSPEAEAQLPFWLAQDGPSFPADSLEEGALQSDLAVHEFEFLEANAPHLYERVAAALVAASGQPELLVHLVGHGREGLFDEVDPTRTCGWFTTHTPLLLSGSLSEVTAQLHSMPQHGLAHGALRYYHPRGSELSSQDRVKVLYNFLGDAWDGIFRGPLLHRPEEEFLWPPNHCAAHNLADFWLYLHAYVYEGALRVRFVYSTKNFQAKTIHALEARMRQSLRAGLSETVSIAP